MGFKHMSIKNRDSSHAGFIVDDKQHASLTGILTSTHPLLKFFGPQRFVVGS